MHRLYPISKGDQLCPLGFHPQVRWPTRCKRCFRDYKEHGGKNRGDEAVAASSPNISADASAISKSQRSWTSTQNLSSAENNSNGDIELRKRPVSWNSTPDLDEKNATSNNEKKPNDVNVSVKVSLPNRRHTTIIDPKELEESMAKQRPPAPPSRSSSSTSIKDRSDDTVILKTDSLAERVRKMNLLKKQNSAERESSRERSVPRKIEKEKSPVKEKSPIPPPVPAPRIDRDAKKRLSLPAEPVSLSSKKESSTESPSKKKEITLTKKTTVITAATNNHEETIKKDVQFLMQIKDKNMEKKRSDDLSSMTTETTDTTIVGAADYHLKEEIKHLQEDLAAMKTRAEKAEREKSDLLLRRLASLDTVSNRTAASEALKLQEKVNELKNQVDELKDDKKNLNTKLRQLETKTTKSTEEDLRKKLKAAEQLCEELMDENNKVKKDLRVIEQEMDEMHDSFREDQTSEYTNIKKDLEMQTKNCRILSFKLKKSERKIETLEKEKQLHSSVDLANKVKMLENDLKLANELSRRLQTELDQSKSPGIMKKAPNLGTIGKSTSADSARYNRASLTRGSSQEDPEQIRRDLQDSLEREADLKEQLKYAEEEADAIRKKATRMEDENESLMMQLKKMASKSRSRKLSPTPNRLTPEPPHERDEGISDEDDPAELRVLLELNEQEASILRIKVEDLENENKDIKSQIKELQDKLKSNDSSNKKSSLSLLSSKNSTTNDKKIKQLEDDLAQLRKTLTEKERTITNLQGEIAAAKKFKNSPSPAPLDTNVDFKKQLQVVEQEAQVLRTKITNIEKENEKLLVENKKLLMQSLRKNSIPNIAAAANDSSELAKLKDTVSILEMERDLFKNRLQVMRLETENKLPPRAPKNPTDMITRPTLQKWVRELEDEIYDLRIMVYNSSAEKQNKLESEKESLETELKSAQDELEKLKKSKSGLGAEKEKEFEQKLKKSEDEAKGLAVRVKDLESKLKKLETQNTKTESSKSLLDAKLKYERDKTSNLEKDLEKEKKEREKWEKRTNELDDELTSAKKNLEKIKSTLEKEIKDLKSKVGTPKLDSSATSKQLTEMRKQNEDLLTNIAKEMKKYSELNAKYESLSEENVLMKAQLSIEKKNLETEKQSIKQKLNDFDLMKAERSELQKKLTIAEKRLKEYDIKNLKTNNVEHEKKLLKSTLEEKDVEYNRLKNENEMNIDLVFQLRKDNEDLLQKLKDYEKINKAQASMSSSNNTLENEIKTMKIKLANAELNTKSEIASTRLRYEQQIKNLNVEINAMQRQCERFKKDRDSFKQLLELAQKQIGDLKHNTGSGRQSRSSKSSGDEDDLKGKIIGLEQQIGCLEDQLSEARLDGSKYKNQLVSERTANEIKISEMTSKLNEYEEDRLIASGRARIAGIKTKLELSWQREREEQQRILQETSTLARDLRQTLFEVERERDKERIESKRKLEQLKRTQEEEVDESRKKVSELQCDLLELRDAHAKLRTANEKLRRERERYERELIRRRMEQDGDRKVGTLLQTVDELVKIAPDLKMATNQQNKISHNNSSNNSLKPDSTSVRRSRSPSPIGITADQIANVLARLADASEELRRYQRMNEDEIERNRVRRGNLRRATSTENDGGSSNSGTMPRAPGRLHRSQNGSLIRKSLSLDQANRADQSIWRQDDGSMSSMQSIDSEMGGGLIRDSDLDSRLSGGSTQSDIPRTPRKKKRGLMGKLRSLTKSGRNAESEGSMQGSDSDISLSSDIRSSKKDLRNRLSDMFRRSGSTSRGGSTDNVNDSLSRPVAVTVVRIEDDVPKYSPVTNNVNSLKPITKPVAKPPTPTTPIMRRKIAK